MMSGAFAVLGLRAVAHGQFDAVAVQMIDGPDMDAVSAHHRHMFPDRAMLGHGSSPRCPNHHTRRGGESIHRRGETGRFVRSAERRGGKTCGRTCTSRCTPEKKKKK